MSDWYKNTEYVACDFKTIKGLLESPSTFIQSVTQGMPSVKEAKLADVTEKSFTLNTDGGPIQFTDLRLDVAGELLTLKYKKTITSGSKNTSVQQDIFQKEGNMVKYTKVIQSMEAPGIGGLFYTLFAKKKVGEGLEKVTKQFLESKA